MSSMPALAPKPRDVSGRALLVLALSLVGAACMTYYHVALFMPRVREAAAARRLAGAYAFGDDFYPIWLTARERPRDLYSVEVTREIQQALFGRPLDPRVPTDPPIDYRTFAYPAFTDLLFWPAAQVPFPILRIILVLAFAIVTGLSVPLWTRAVAWNPGWLWVTIAVLLTIGSYPVLEGLYAGQLGLLVGFLLAGSLLALKRDRYLLAGALLALTLIKPQMTVLPIAYLIVWAFYDWPRRKGFLLGLSSMLGSLVLGALLVWPNWIQSWVRVVLAYHRYAKPPLLSEVLAAPLGPRLGTAVVWVLLLASVGAAAALLWRNRKAALGSPDFWLTLCLLLCITTIALLPGQAVHDHVILLPGIFLVVMHSRDGSANRVSKVLLMVAGSVLVWPWVAAIALVVMRPIVSAQVFYSKTVFALPLRTAAVFPFVVLALLALMYKSLSRSRRPRASELTIAARPS